MEDKYSRRLDTAITRMGYFKSGLRNRLRFLRMWR